MTTVFGCVYGLLLSPEKSDTLDSNHALAFHNDNGAYEGDIIQHTLQHASISRLEWKHAINAIGLSVTECLEQSQISLQAVITRISDEQKYNTDQFDFMNAKTVTNTHKDILVKNCKVSLLYIDNARQWVAENNSISKNSNSSSSATTMNSNIDAVNAEILIIYGNI